MSETKIFLSFYLFPKGLKDFSDFLFLYLIFMLAHRNSYWIIFQGDFPIKTPWKPSKIRAEALGRFVGWQIWEGIRQGNVATWKQNSLQIPGVNPTETSNSPPFRNANPTPCQLPPAMPFQAHMEKQNALNMCRQINILTSEFYGGNIIAEPLMGIISVWSRVCSYTSSTRGW